MAEPDGTPEHAGDGQADDSVVRSATASASPVIDGISPDNGVSSHDGVTNSPYISTLRVGAVLMTSSPSTANGTAIGQTIAAGEQHVDFQQHGNPLKRRQPTHSRPWRPISSGYSTAPSMPYQVVIDTHVPNPPVLERHLSGDGLERRRRASRTCNTPTFSGTTEPFAVVDLYANGSTSAVRGDRGRHQWRLVLHGRSTGTGHRIPGHRARSLVRCFALDDSISVVGGLLADSSAGSSAPRSPARGLAPARPSWPTARTT